MKHERLWAISTVVMALIQSGLTLEVLGEHQDGYWDVFPQLDPTECARIPLTFSIMARK